MPVFIYRACDSLGHSVQGTLTADTAAAGRERLRERGLRLAEFQAAPAERKALSLSSARSRRRRDQVAEFARELAMLLSAGVPLVEALDVLIRQQAGAFATVLRQVRERVASGQPLGDSLGEYPVWFDEIFRSAVAVGQTVGHLDTSLNELAGFMFERETTRTRLITALAYPMILGVVGTGVVLFLMSYVVPQLLAVLESAGRPLPMTTVLMKGLSDVLIAHWIVLSACAFACGVVGAAAFRWRPSRTLWHRFQLVLPLAGPLLRKAVISRFAQTMSLLLRSGVPFVESLRLARQNARHLVLADELEQMESAIRSGSDIAPTLQSSRIFPPLVVHVVNVGQQSGELVDMLAQLKDAYETEVRLAVGKFTATLEPLLIVVMSAVVGFIVFATMMPILEVTRSLQ